MMSNILSSFSLLFAALALFYNSWYDEVMHIINNWNPPPEQRKKELEKYLYKAKTILKRRLLPLLLGSGFISILLLIESCRIIIDCVNVFFRFKLLYLKYFDTVKAVIVILFFFSVILFLHILKLYIKLLRDINK